MTRFISSAVPVLPALLLMMAGVRAGQVVFTEVMYNPPAGKPEFIEVQNLTSNRLDAARWRLTGGVSYEFPDFNSGNTAAHFLREYERIVLSAADEATTRAAWPTLPPNVRVYGPWTGSLNNAGDFIRLVDFAGAERATLEYGDGGKWPAAADGAGHSLQVINPDRDINNWRNWRASRFAGGSPGAAEIETLEEAVPNPELTQGATITVTEFTQAVGPAASTDTRWRYYNGLQPPQADWASVPDAALPPLAVPDNPDNPGWGPLDPASQGFAPLGTETAASPFPGIRTQVDQRTNLVTYYYRATFNWTGPTVGCSFVIDHYLDDGGIYFLNGQEIGRQRMPNPSGHFNTADPNASPDAIFEPNAVTGGPDKLDGRLVTGANVFALELHQNIAGSADHVACPRMKINVPVQPEVVINEVRPAAAGAGFVELYNLTPSPVDLTGWYLSDTPSNLTKFRIPGPLTLPASGFATVGYTESGLSLTSPVVVYLTKPDGVTRQSAISAAIPLDGRSLGRKPAGGGSWFLFLAPTPGQNNTSAAGSGVTPRMNEVGFSPAGRVEWIEFTAVGGNAAAGTWFVSAAPPGQPGAVAVPAVSSGSLATLPVDFAVPNGELRLHLFDGAGNVAAVAELERRDGLPAVQWFEGEWYNSPTGTPGAVNNPPRSTDIVINEIMAGPPSRHDGAKFVEIYNRGEAAVDLEGWRFVDGFRYDFPAGTVIGPGQYLVVAADPAWMMANYPGLTGVLGPWEGNLRGGGELLRLEDGRWNLADAVDYDSGGQWPGVANGDGSSLELLHPDMDNAQPSAWRASDESAKAGFTSFTHTGTYKELRGAPTAITGYRELLLNLVSDGHVVLRNVRLTQSTNPSVNLITTGDATSHNGNGGSGFLCTGTHCLSDTLGDGFHLRSFGGGDTKANKAEVDITGITPNNTSNPTIQHTLTFEAKWISGMPLLVAQTWDRSFGRLFRLPVPNNLGTPGTVNSRAIATPAPTVDWIAHLPAVPTSSQSVVVTARVSSVSPLTSVVLRNRTDNGTRDPAWNNLAMNDSGTGGDAAAGDGIWTVTVPPRSDSTITHYYVQATASNGRGNECPRGAAGVVGVNGSVLTEQPRHAMWIVDNSPPVTAPGTMAQRFILSLWARNSMNAATGYSATYDFDHPRMSNFGWNATIIMNERDVIHNGEIRRGGSPWTRTSANTLDRTRWRPPGDNRWRNRTKSGADNDAAAANRFHNRLTRYMMHLFGYPVPDAEFIQQIVNADAPRLGDDMEQTDSDFFERAYPEGEGELFEIDDAWYMYDTNGMNDRLDAGSVTGRWFLTDWTNASAGANPSDESPIYFHGNWPLRFPESRYDYASLASFIKVAWNGNAAVSAAQDATYREQMQRMIDTERAAIYTAVRGYVGDWDNFTLNRGKNGYFYRRPTDGRFEFHHWDSDLAYQNTGEGFLGSAGGIGWTNFANRPWFRQRLAFYLSELVGRYTRNSPRMTAWLNAMNYQSANPNTLAPFKTSGYNYATSWFAGRETPAINFIGSTNYNRAFTVTTANNQTVTTPLFNLAGEASTRTARVEVVGRPGAVLTWTATSTANLGLWTLTGVPLQNGLNALTVRALDGGGTVLASTVINVTLTVNGPPVASLAMTPASGHVTLNETVALDASGSFDPEQQPLGVAWSVSPATGAVLTGATSAQASVRFTVPGVYTVTLTVTDAAAATATQQREVTVTSAGDASLFNTGLQLGPEFTVEGVEYRDNFSASTWYSLEDLTGRLLVQSLDDAARPLATTSPTHPLITKDLPDAGDFVLETLVQPSTRQFGSWQAGLWLRVTEGATEVNYAFALEGGTVVAVRRGALPAAYALVGTTAPHTGTEARLRVRRQGTSLVFQRMVGTAWSTVQTVTLPAGSVARRGGVFQATSAAINAQTAFNYLLLADPAKVSPLVTALRITEVHYNPAPGGVEFIELRNTGSTPLSLEGASFDIGAPFAMAGIPETAYTFGALTLAAGEYLVIPENTAAFRSLYGNAARLAPPWTSGGLSNAGERITLRDADGNVIHDFTYDDAAPWPVAADGTGPSMEVVDLNGDYDSGTNWRASSEPAGSPGFTGAGPDSDGDGVPDSTEALFGTDPANGSSRPAATATVAPGTGNVTVTWPFAAGVTYRVETSTDLASWSLAATVVGTGSWTDTATLGVPRRWYRVAAVSP